MFKLLESKYGSFKRNLEGELLGGGWITVIGRGYRRVEREKAANLELDLIALRDTLPRFQIMSSWWEWYEGLEPLFWRWTEGYQDQAREGVQPGIRDDPPIWTSPHREDNYPVARKKMAGNMRKIVLRGYIIEGVILVLNPSNSPPRHSPQIPNYVFLVGMVWGFGTIILEMNRGLSGPSAWRGTARDQGRSTYMDESPQRG